MAEDVGPGRRQTLAEDGRRLPGATIPELGVHLIVTGKTDLYVTDGSHLLVSKALARSIAEVAPRGIDVRPVRVNGRRPRRDLVELDPRREVHLGPSHFERDADGEVWRPWREHVRLVPFEPAVGEGLFAVVEQQRSVVFTAAVRDVIAQAEPAVGFEGIWFEGDPVVDGPPKGPLDAFELYQLVEDQLRRLPAADRTAAMRVKLTQEAIRQYGACET